MVSAGKRGDTLIFVRRGAISTSSGSSIPADGALLAAYGSGLRAQEVQAMGDGDTVKILLATLPRIPRGAAPAMIIGGWPRILRGVCHSNYLETMGVDPPITRGYIPILNYPTPGPREFRL